jgi:hypothetical protein
MSIPYSSSAGFSTGLAASLAGFLSSFLLSAAGVFVAAGADDPSPDPPPTPPKKSVTDLPLTPLTTAETKEPAAVASAALSTALIDASVISAP